MGRRVKDPRVYRRIALHALQVYLSKQRGRVCTVTLPKLRGMGLLEPRHVNGNGAVYFHEALMGLCTRPICDAVGNWWLLYSVRIRRKRERGKYVYLFSRIGEEDAQRLLDSASNQGLSLTKSGSSSVG